MADDLKADAALAAVLSSRICHDLVSPVGAIVNGVDLIREIGSGGLEDEFGMIGQSADRASTLLQFYRIAFGYAANDAEDIARASLSEKAAALIATARVQMIWNSLSGPAIGRNDCRLLCQLLLCARSVIGMSGAVEVNLPEDANYPMSLRVLGGAAPDAAGRLAILSDPAGLTELAPRTVEFALAAATAEELDVRIEVAEAPAEIRLVAVKNAF